MSQLLHIDRVIDHAFPMPESNAPITDTTTLVRQAAAALFNPLRKAVQSRVDRRFNRSKYDAERVAALFAESLKSHVDVTDLVDGWVSVVAETVHPATAAVWVKNP